MKGIGIHTGEPCQMIFRPSKQGFISFLRTDIKDSLPIEAKLENVSSTMRGTNLKNALAQVHTVEHVLSALHALNISDMVVEMDGPEPPVTDGSSIEYIRAITNAGIEDLGVAAPVLTISKPIVFSEGNIKYKAEPAGKLSFAFVYTRENSFVKRQEYEAALTDYAKEIAPARTFGYEEEIAFLRAHGLGKGGNADNCVIIAKDKYLTSLRFGTELARHKILDIIGDLKLIGKTLGNMRITCEGGGHKTNVEFAKILLREGQNG
jgi:UDP-3-O-[3-hydroxymyristoyl] N-acetylglucosamine deacetylase